MMRRLPRLAPAKAKAFVAEVERQSLEQLELRSRTLLDLETERFAATGLPKVGADELQHLRNELQATMIAAGFPGTTQSVRQAVDRALAVKLATMDLPIGEMLRSDTWTWISLHLLPHFVKWRFVRTDSRITEERFLGTIHRNALGRLWLRGRVFDRGGDSHDQWGLVNTISEDASVAILERTSVSADHRLARFVGEFWLATKSKGLDADGLLRNAMIRIRVQSALIEVATMSDTELSEFIRDHFRSTSELRSGISIDAF